MSKHVSIHQAQQEVQDQEADARAQKARDLLWKSLQKWEANLEYVTTGNHNIFIGIYQCPLCQKYFNVACNGCPIGNYCRGTPYHRVEEALDKFDPERYETVDELRESVEAEVVFLRNLYIDKVFENEKDNQ